MIIIKNNMQKLCNQLVKHLILRLMIFTKRQYIHQNLSDLHYEIITMIIVFDLSFSYIFITSSLFILIKVFKQQKLIYFIY